MRISVLGFGHVGGHLARLWIAAGHAVTVGLRNGSAHTEAAKASGATVLLPHVAAEAAEITVLALPWPSIKETLNSVASWEGKILVDPTNPLRGDLSVLVPESGSGGQQVAEWAPGARVVKAFNTIGAAMYGDPAFDIVYCGDDAEAKSIVRGLIADTKMRPQDVGPLRNAAYLEHIAGLWIDLAMKGRVHGRFGFNLVVEP
jgi:predicted dinucleotide-binding enzyme